LEELSKGRGDVDAHVEQMVTPHLQFADRVVCRQGQVDHGPRLRARAEDFPDRPEAANFQVLAYAGAIIEDELPIEAVGVG